MMLQMAIATAVRHQRKEKFVGITTCKIKYLHSGSGKNQKPC